MPLTLGSMALDRAGGASKMHGRPLIEFLGLPDGESWTEFEQITTLQGLRQDIVDAAEQLVWSVEREDADWYVPLEWLTEAVHAYQSVKGAK